MESGKGSNVSRSLEIVDLDPKVAEELLKLFTGDYEGYVRVGPKGYFFPQKYRQDANNIYNMPIRKDDVFVTSYPRSGNHILRSIRYSSFIHPVMEEKLRIENSDSEKKLKILDAVVRPGWDILKDMTSQRFIKTHLPLSLLPPELLDTTKMVYVARDPRDAVVSFYHLTRFFRTHGYIGDFKTFWSQFRRNLSYWAPFFEHVKEAWEKRHHPNMLFLFYEDLSKDLPAAVRKVAAFFNKKFSEEQVAKLCDHLSIENFKKNKSINIDTTLTQLGIVKPEEPGFVRKGVVGGWRDYFDEEMRAELDEWLADNLRGSDLRFPTIQLPE